MCKKETVGDLKASNRWRHFFDQRAFLMGFTRSFLLCPTLIAILLWALVSFSPVGVFAVTVLFGLGTALSPMLLFGGTIGWLFNKSPNYSKWISKIGGVILILLAVQLLLSAATTNSYVNSITNS
jgi:sulfite exporter TauE/SafE